MAGSYDRWSGFYDRLIPNRVYSKVVWSTHPSEYVEFAREAVASGTGPMLDVAGGTAVFTAGVYREADRPIVFSDLSGRMLERARGRIGETAGVEFVQADATDPPFERGQFETVACMSALHVFPDPAGLVAALAPLARPGGRLFLSGLVAETRIGSAYLRALHRAGEVGPPMSEAELVTAVESAAGLPVRATRRGSMTYLVAG